VNPLTLAAVAALVAGFLGFLGGSHHRGLLAERDLAKERAAFALAHSVAASAAQAAEAQARAEERRRTFRVMETSDAAQTAAAAARVDRARADRAAGQLRDAYSAVATALTSRAGQDSAPAAGGPPGVGAGLVLADLFSGGDALLREAAAALDQSLIAGLACERSYDSMTR
jgi:hypothetical protein